MDNGRGMKALGMLFKLGETVGRSAGDIGIYGMGGTQALLYLGDRVQIWTLNDGLVCSDTVIWDEVETATDWFSVSSDWFHADLSNTPPDLLRLGQGTMIRIYLAKERILKTFNVQRDLTATYAPALRMGWKLVWKTEGIVKDLAEDIPELEQAVILDGVVDVRGRDLLPVTGRVGLDESLSGSKSVVSVGYGPRIIFKTKECYGGYSGKGVTGGFS